MRTLKKFIKEVIEEYWGEPAGSVLRNQNTILAKKVSDKSRKLDNDPLFLDDEDGVIVPKDIREKIKKYFEDMKLLPSDKKGKSYK